MVVGPETGDAFADAALDGATANISLSRTMISDGTCGPENSIPIPATFMIELPLIDEIKTKRELSDDLRKRLRAAIDQYQQTFMASQGAASQGDGAAKA